MADKIINDFTVLFKTKLDEKSKLEVGKNLKGLLENAVIGFDEAETKKNLQPIIRMMKTMFDKAEMAFDADKLLSMPSRQALQSMADLSVEQLQTAFDRALAKSGGVKIDFGNVDLSGMTEPLERVAEELTEISRKIANDTKKSVDDIDLAIKRLDKVKPKKINAKVTVDGVEKETEKEISKVEQTVDAIEKTLGAVNNPKSLNTEKAAVKALEKARTKYSESVANDDPWEIQYQHMISFVSKYDAMTKKIKPIMDVNHPEFKELYSILSPKAGAAKISLEHFVDVAKGNELTEYKNQPWARESTLKKIEQTLKNGISVKGDVGDDKDDDLPKEPPKLTPPDSDGRDGDKNKKLNTKVSLDVGESAEAKAARLAQEKAAEAARKAEAAEKALAEARKVSAKQVYRVVYPPLDEEDLPREERKAQYGGAEIWTSSPDVADTYATGEENPVKLQGSISADNAYIIDAGGATWKDFNKMKVLSPDGIDEDGKVKFTETALRDAFPELFSRIDNKEFGYEEDIQAELYKLIHSLGYDSVVTKNVIDAKDVDYYKEPSTIYAVFDDKALKVLGAYAMEEQDEDGVTTFEETASVENIPEFYKQPKSADIQTEVAAHQQNTVAIIEETRVQEKLNDAKTQNADVDDDTEIISKENGQLEDKLELLRDIAEEYGKDISQKQRNAYEKLNQKEMDSGLTPKEDDKYYELGEQIEEADDALIKFGETYDKIILKLANGKKVEILPDDKGLRSLYKFSDEYGETYNGVEIDDVIYQRVEKEISAHQENTSAIVAETQAQEKLNDAKVEAQQIDAKEVVATTADKPIIAVEPNDISETKDSIQTEELRQLLSAITYNVKVIQDVEPAEENKVSIDADALKNVLNSITYSVKIAHDDTDKQANKIAIDESVLESTLKRVFTNVLNPQTEQAAVETKNEPWALENTLQSVRVVLDQIQTNTSRIGTVQQTPANDVDSILTVISKNVAEINTKIVKGMKAPNKEATKTQKVPTGRDAQILTERIATQKLSLAKFKAELETSGRITEDVAKKIRGLAISLGMVKDSKGLTRWGEKFKQQKLSVGITDIENKEEKQFEQDLLKEQEIRLKTLNKLYQEYGVLVERAGAASGHFGEQLRDEVLAKESEIMTLRNSMDIITPEMSYGFDAAFDKGRNIESTKQYESLAKKSDADEATRLKNIANLEKEIGKLRADAYTFTNPGVRNALEEEIQLRERLIELQRQGLEMDAGDESYYRQIAANRTRQAKKDATQEARAQQDAFKEAKKMAKKNAMVGKTSGAISKAENLWLGAQATDEPLPPGLNNQIDELYRRMVALRTALNEINQADVVTDEQQNDLRNQTIEVNSLTSEIGELLSEYQRLSGNNVNPDDIMPNPLGADANLNAYRQQLTNYVREITHGNGQIKSFDAATRTLTYTVKTGANEFTEYTAAVRRADNMLVSVQGTTKKTETFLEATTRKMKELTSYFSGMAVFNRIGQELRRGIQYIREIDLALTELKKVTDETEETYDKFLDTAAKTADKVGSTIQKVVSSTADWARLGSILAKTNIRPII